ncbi:MAG: MarR family winged helix-turn-helix transcriptional regulator [Polyangiales bacterium]
MQLKADVVSVLDDLRRIIQVLRESSREAERTLGVSGAQLFALRALADGELSLNELAARTRTHQSTVSVVVKRLVAAGLVNSAAARDDARRLVLALTPRGRALLARAPLAAQHRLIAGLEGLPAAQRLALSGALRALVHEMGLDDEAPAMFFEDGEAQRTKKRARDA